MSRLFPLGLVTMSRLFSLGLVRAASSAMARRQFAQRQGLVCSWPSVLSTRLKHASSAQTPSPDVERPCSRYPVPDLHTLPQDMRDRIQEVEEKSGFVPNVFKALAYRPDEFRAFFAYYDALMEKTSDTLTKAEKEMIVVVTSSYNDCLYCVIAHGALHRIYSKNKYVADQLAVNWEIADIGDRERAIVKFAMSLCKAQHVADHQIEDLKRYGLTDDDVWDVGAITALFALSNRMAHLTSMCPNTEFSLMGRLPYVKKEK